MYRFKIINKHVSVSILGLFYLASVSIICAESAKPLRLVDLTHSFNQTTIYWPNSKSFEMEIVYRGKTDFGIGTKQITYLQLNTVESIWTPRYIFLKASGEQIKCLWSNLLPREF